MTPEAIIEAVQTAVKTADSPEGNVYRLTNTAMLPVERNDVGRGGSTTWYTDVLPRIEAYGNPVAAPRADIHFGYLVGFGSTWKVEENATINHPMAIRRTKPAKGNCFPFLVCEMKSEAMGGTLWQAEN